MLERFNYWAQPPAEPVLFNSELSEKMQLQHEFLPLKYWNEQEIIAFKCSRHFNDGEGQRQSADLCKWGGVRD